MSINLEFTDIEQNWLMTVENAVLNAFPGRQDPAPTVTLRMSSVDFKLMMTGRAAAADLLGSGALEVQGDLTTMADFAGLFDKFDRFFPIVTPRDQ